MSQSIELAPVSGQQGSLGAIVTFQVTADEFPVPSGGTFGILAVLDGSIPEQDIGYAPIGAGSPYVPGEPYSANRPYTDAGVLLGGNVLNVPAAVNNTGEPWAPSVATPLVIAVGVLPEATGQPTGWGLFTGNSVQMAPAVAPPAAPTGLAALIANPTVVTQADLQPQFFALQFGSQVFPQNVLNPAIFLSDVGAARLAALIGGTVSQANPPAKAWGMYGAPPPQLVGAVPQANYIALAGVGTALGGDIVEALALPSPTVASIQALFS